MAAEEIALQVVDGVDGRDADLSTQELNNQGHLSVSTEAGMLCTDASHYV